MNDEKTHKSKSKQKKTQNTVFIRLSTTYKLESVWSMKVESFWKRHDTTKGEAGVDFQFGGKRPQRQPKREDAIGGKESWFGANSYFAPRWGHSRLPWPLLSTSPGISSLGCLEPVCSLFLCFLLPWYEVTPLGARENLNGSFGINFFAVFSMAILNSETVNNIPGRDKTWILRKSVCLAKETARVSISVPRRKFRWVSRYITRA